MSPRDANPVKGSSSPPNASYAAVLTWEVFVTPGIPIVTADRPPGVRETYFQAMASTLIYGIRDAVLVDALMTAEQAHALADWVASKGKNWSPWNLATPTRTLRAVCMPLRSGSWLPAMRPTMTFTSNLAESNAQK